MTNKCNRLVDAGRRQFLRGGALAAAGAAVVTATSAPAETTTGPGPAVMPYPGKKLGNVADLKVNEPVDISYPDGDSPGVVLKLGKAVEGGVGPDGDIVAYSVLCPHKGWPLSYNAEDRSFNCPGHYSRYDAEAGGQEIWGHATQNLPQFVLTVDTKGDIYANGCTDLIFGRPSNVL